MATKKEEKTTKKTVAPKKTTATKKTTVKKPAKKVETKIEVKKEVKVDTKVKKEKVKVSFKERIKKFFNSPQPLFVVFTLIIIGLLMYIVQYTKHDTIMTGSYIGEQGSIGAIHCFTNHKINVFYATPVTYTGEDKKIYGYDMGYYYESGEELKPFLVRSGQSDTALSIKDVVTKNSSFNISELASSNSYFTEEVMNNLDKLHFIVYAATTKGSTAVDYIVDFKVDVDKIV